MKLFLQIVLICVTLQLSAQTFSALPPIPEPVSNNGVTHGSQNGIPHIFSFCGIDETKEPAGIHLKAFSYNTQSEEWSILPSITDTNGGKIAASASTVKNKIYIIGGYHVDENFGEISSDKVHIFNPETMGYESDGAAIPIPIDDQVQVVWRDSLIFVITGWSNTTNVVDVQIYNPETDSWSVGTSVPNQSNYKVFGASGTIIGDTIYYLGGAKISAAFGSAKHLRKGVINPDNPLEITWTGEINEEGIAYRSAALTYEEIAYWVGGSEITYNFDGLSYNSGSPVPPKDKIISYDPSWPLTKAREEFGQCPPIMDLRGIAQISETEFATAGGMIAGPDVTNQSWKINFAQIASTENEISPFFKTYPNPANDLLQIQFKGYFEAELKDIMGRVLQTKSTFESTQFNTSNFENGLYIVSLKKNGVIIHSEKILIQH